MSRRGFLVCLLALWLGAPGCGRSEEGIAPEDGGGRRPLSADPPRAAEAGTLAVVRLRIDGMTWGGWAFLAKRALEGLNRVQKAEVSFARSEAVVTYEEGTVTIEEMTQAIGQYGFRATVKAQKTR